MNHSWGTAGFGDSLGKQQTDKQALQHVHMQKIRNKIFKGVKELMFGSLFLPQMFTYLCHCFQICWKFLVLADFSLCAQHFWEVRQIKREIFESCTSGSETHGGHVQNQNQNATHNCRWWILPLGSLGSCKPHQTAFLIISELSIFCPYFMEISFAPYCGCMCEVSSHMSHSPVVYHYNSIYCNVDRMWSEGK